ncbi:MAG: recombination protein RecR [Candidatus Buchananbacteria bacterium RIFCSPLOWO2_01_FULL_56_15]|uniref:Recombination protein RecR n=2 Tax=Candidatus Buchananiibacteriota TaxID=1817903 RepID=A0A1G1YCK6_9BACT|nr:MAG: recombination protein RecR [Candidatus Buchananbacteria bacterium RIFCSPHIGHO2_02_FULL_56_16]OGY55386.1 MAG: recombination protein RecR [Candidatus Buchananbacteria bacterium RIFCSPLOWO2_01_FULL_56_15]
MTRYPAAIQNLISQFAKLPGVGTKTAERFVFNLLSQPSDALVAFGSAIGHLKDTIKRCGQCHNFAETDPCHLCGDRSRNRQVICVVAKPQDVLAIEKTSTYQGSYHVLGGLVDPLEGISPKQLTVAALVERLKTNGISEVILALNPDMAGETTMLYLTKLLKQRPNLTVTRLARGLPTGSDLEYTDEVTLSNALSGRREV